MTQEEANSTSSARTSTGRRRRRTNYSFWRHKLIWPTLLALAFLIVGLVSPGWFRFHAKLADKDRNDDYSYHRDTIYWSTYQDYGLWSVTQCLCESEHDCDCETRSYHFIKGKNEKSNVAILDIPSFEDSGVYLRGVPVENPTLQSVLKQKYNIDETLYAEGRFVSLIGDYAPSLVCLGLSMECLIIASINLSGDVMDYDLTSIIPLSVLSLSCDCNNQKIKITNRFKTVKIFQLCSSVNQSEIWDNFTTIIEKIQSELDDIWQEAPLKPVSKFPWSALSKFKPFSKVSLSEVSYPVYLATEKNYWSGDVYPQFYNVKNLNTKFDNTYNDVNASNNILVGVSKTSLDANNESKPSLVDEEETPSGGRVAKFFNRLFSRCSFHKKEQNDG